MEHDIKESSLPSKATSPVDDQDTKEPSFSSPQVSAPGVTSSNDTMPTSLATASTGQTQPDLANLDVEALINDHSSATQEQKDAWLIEWNLFLSHFERLERRIIHHQTSQQSLEQSVTAVQADQRACHAAIDRLEGRLDSRNAVIRQLQERLRQNNLPAEVSGMN
ncbi:hypothetical protein NW762_011202 [Fusarium torreyae]|uniref:Uncharacterized protein n=1 Tax=Fusarium torreyae TaxID=1237075 RepID=A0A9W8RTH4_9HYPO|nr:hypothetical protein NW762_011202 [Fusarium torreyae]